MRIILKIQYDGTDFCGWQVQPGKDTVQMRLEDAVFRATGERTSVTASGRTDSGVHAIGQVAHFDTSSSIPPEKFAAALNPFLPPQIKVLKSCLAGEGFHSRFSAKRKTYIYRAYISDVEQPLKSRYSTIIRHEPDVEKMKQAIGFLEGEHDFRCFLASNSSVENTVRTIYRADVSRDGNDLEFTFTGNGFLYNMVRIMVGTLLKIGDGKLTPEDLKDIIEGKNRAKAGITMPPEGLILKEVLYDGVEW